jgi:hypothetical protein
MTDAPPGVEYGDSTFGNESRIGIPWMFLLRDILQVRFTFYSVCWASGVF